MQESRQGLQQDLYSPNIQPSHPEPELEPPDMQASQKQQYQIIKDQSDNQVIMVKIKRGHMLWYKGKILFSNYPVQTGINDTNLFKSIIDMLGIFRVPKGLLNMNRDMAYYVFSREPPYNGKIFTISEDVYKQKFYINLDHLLTINYDSQEYTLSSHPQMNRLNIIHVKNPSDPLFVSLQSTRNSSIVEKYLGLGQSMYLPNACILAMSQSVHYKWDSKYRMAKFSGPGFIFFEPESKMKNMPMRQRELLLANLFLVFFVLFLYLIEWYYFV